MTPPIIYKICLDDIEKSWKFALEYYLDESKPIKDRTNFQKRGLGGIIDSFLNKIIEIAVCKKLHEINPKKIFETDFDIHPLTKKKTEPDIINIVEKNRKSSEPKIYVEIKNSADADDWFVQLYAQNLTDQENIESLGLGSAAVGFTRGINAREPRVWGMRFGMKL